MGAFSKPFEDEAANCPTGSFCPAHGCPLRPISPGLTCTYHHGRDKYLWNEITSRINKYLPIIEYSKTLNKMTLGELNMADKRIQGIGPIVRYENEQVFAFQARVEKTVAVMIRNKLKTAAPEAKKNTKFDDLLGSLNTLSGKMAFGRPKKNKPEEGTANDC